MVKRELFRNVRDDWMARGVARPPGAKVRFKGTPIVTGYEPLFEVVEQCRSEMVGGLVRCQLVRGHEGDCAFTVDQERLHGVNREPG